jgi:HAD superfamily hydrolase (TIGR01484 family)
MTVNVKMIVTDLDGTLLQSDSSISNYSVEIFRKCKENGIKIVFATARTFQGTEEFLNIINCDGAIFENGGIICDEGKEVKHLILCVHLMMKTVSHIGLAGIF